MEAEKPVEKNTQEVDTQPVDAPDDESEPDIYTQSQDETDYWGRLYPLKRKLMAHDLTEPRLTLGKTNDCNLVVRSCELPREVFNIMSRQQFTLSRRQVERRGTPTTCIEILDVSRNGTFVNGSILKRQKPRVLKTNDIIALGKPEYSVYVFIESYVQVSSSLPTKVRKKYDVSRQLGNGAFGVVLLVFNKESCRPMACKKVPDDLDLNRNKLEKSRDKLCSEFQILEKLDHENVVKLIDVIDVRSDKFLILEYMEGKDLAHRIKEYGMLPESLAKFYFFQIASAVEYLHRHNVIHRDLKPANILLATPDEETLLKVTDFGLSKILDSQTVMNSYCGTKMYCAPEILASHGLHEYSSKVDLWSMGVVLYVCLSGVEPFSTDPFLMEEQIKHALYSMPQEDWKQISTFAKSLIDKLLTVKVSDRISVEGVLEDIWLSDGQMRSKFGEMSEKYNSSQCESIDLTTKCLTPLYEKSISDESTKQDIVITSPPKKRVRLM